MHLSSSARSSPVVIKYGGNAMTDEAVQIALAKDLLVLQQRGLRVVVVHGGGPQIDNLLHRLGHEPRFMDGLRVTDEPTMQVVEWVLAGEVQQRLVGYIQACGGRAVGLTGRDGGMVKAHKLKATTGKDYGLVGAITAVDTDLINVLTDAGYIPVISPVTQGKDAPALNINADTLAAKLAVALQASCLCLLSNIPGLLGADGQILTRVTTHTIEELIASGTIHGGMLPKIAGAMEAARLGVGRVHILDGREPNILQRSLLQGAAVGTVLHQS